SRAGRIGLIPSVTASLQKKRVTVVNHHRVDLTLDYCLAANCRIEWAHDDLAKATALLLVRGRQTRWRWWALELGCVSSRRWLASLGGRRTGRRKSGESFLTFSEPENLAEQPSNLFRGLEGRRRGRRQFIFGEALGDRRQQRVHSMLHRSPLGAISGEIALVHHQRDGCQIDLPYEAGHSRDL